MPQAGTAIRSIFAVGPSGPPPGPNVEVAAGGAGSAGDQNVFLTKQSLTFPTVSVIGATILKFIDSTPSKSGAIVVALIMGGFVTAVGLTTGSRDTRDRIIEAGVGLINIFLLAIAIYGGAVAVTSVPGL